jgi:transcriptional regulator with XRE-family HTH domain
MLYIAENLKALRKGKDMTQEDVAEILSVSPQSVSKWERGDTFPDITLLPALANLYKTSVDALIGMDKINGIHAKNSVFAKAHQLMRDEAYKSAAAVYADALKVFPNDEGLMSDLAMALALDSETEKLGQAISLCERVLSGNQREKVHHTTRAALSFIYLKSGERDKAIAVAKNLPHVRESRETILAEFDKEPSISEIDAYLKFIVLGEDAEQDVIAIDFGVDMISVADILLEKTGMLREEIKAPHTNEGHRRLPVVRIMDNAELSPKQVRVRYYADYMLDKAFSDHNAATGEVMAILRKIAQV